MANIQEQLQFEGYTLRELLRERSLAYEWGEDGLLQDPGKVVSPISQQDPQEGPIPVMRIIEKVVTGSQSPSLRALGTEGMYPRYVDQYLEEQPVSSPWSTTKMVVFTTTVQYISLTGRHLMVRYVTASPVPKNIPAWKMRMPRTQRILKAKALAWMSRLVATTETGLRTVPKKTTNRRYVEQYLKRFYPSDAKRIDGVRELLNTLKGLTDTY